MTDIPTKKDGTADMRYSESKEAASSGLISKDDVIEGRILISKKILNYNSIIILDANDDDDDDQKEDDSDDERSKEKQRDEE